MGISASSSSSLADVNPIQFRQAEGIHNATSALDIRNKFPFKIVTLKSLYDSNLAKKDTYWIQDNNAVENGFFVVTMTFPRTSEYLPVGDILFRAPSGSSLNRSNFDSEKITVLLVKNEFPYSTIIEDSDYHVVSRSRGCEWNEPSDKWWSTLTIKNGSTDAETKRIYKKDYSSGDVFWSVGDLINVANGQDCWLGKPSCSASPRNYAAVNSKYLRVTHPIVNSSTGDRNYIAATRGHNCTYYHTFNFTSPFGTFANITSDDISGFAAGQQPWAYFDIIPEMINSDCCISGYSIISNFDKTSINPANGLTDFEIGKIYLNKCPNAYQPDSGIRFIDVTRTMTKDQLKNDAFLWSTLETDVRRKGCYGVTTNPNGLTEDKIKSIYKNVCPNSFQTGSGIQFDNIMRIMTKDQLEDDAFKWSQKTDGTSLQTCYGRLDVVNPANGLTDAQIKSIYKNICPRAFEPGSIQFDATMKTKTKQQLLEDAFNLYNSKGYEEYAFCNGDPNIQNGLTENEIKSIYKNFCPHSFETGSGIYFNGLMQTMTKDHLFDDAFIWSQKTDAFSLNTCYGKLDPVNEKNGLTDEQIKAIYKYSCPNSFKPGSGIQFDAIMRTMTKQELIDDAFKWSQKTDNTSVNSCYGVLNSSCRYVYDNPEHCNDTIRFTSSMDCLVSNWSDSGTCSVTECGKNGTKPQARTVLRDATNGGESCSTLPLTQTIPCSTPACPVNCEVSSWSDSGTCSATACGTTGKKPQKRTVVREGANGGTSCSTFQLTQEVDCSTPACPVNCEVSSWSDSGTCSATACGTTGKKPQKRTVVREGANGGTSCSTFQLTQEVDCSTPACPPTDCKLSSWANSTPCSASACGDKGTRTQKRTILSEAINGGEPCSASTLSREIDCYADACPPINCELSPWVDSDTCNVTECGTNGKKPQTRTVVRNEAYGGTPCSSFQLTQQVDCSAPACPVPVNCELSPWIDFGTCSATSCGTNGKKPQTRTVVRNEAYGGTPCSSFQLTQQVDCSAPACSSVSSKKNIYIGVGVALGVCVIICIIIIVVKSSTKAANAASN